MREGRLRIFAPVIKKNGEKGEKGEGPLETGAGTTSSISVYLLNHYTVLQKNAFARKGRLRISAPIIKKKGEERGKKGEKGGRPPRRPVQERLAAFPFIY